VGRLVLALAILGVILGVAALGPYEIDAISANTSANLGLVSLAATAIAVVGGFAMRHRWRAARDGMYVGLATFGAWFALVFYALAVDTP
jgi:hypothetical protein